MPEIMTQVDGTWGGCFLASVGSQITVAPAPNVADKICYVMADNASDEGVLVSFRVPGNYNSAPKLIISGMLDGAPGAANVLGFLAREHAAKDNESGNVQLGPEQTASATIGSNGSGHSDEDILDEEITLTGTYEAGDQVVMRVGVDGSATTYAGNFLFYSAVFGYMAA